MSRLFDKANICQSIKVIFVGLKEQMDMLARHTLGSSHITEQGYVLYQWICILKKVNKLYANIEVPAFEDVENIIQECDDTIIEEAGIVDEASFIHSDDTRDDD
eukprot:6583544-Ditylum_brightwellii.AAC.1